jgi:AcrR family transcriptional regulator
MMTVASTTDEGPPASLRERKKLATRRELRRVALRMIADRGYSNVTVEEIAEAALFGADPELAAATRDAIVHQWPGEPVLKVLRAIMTSQAAEVVNEFAELGGEPLEWLARMRASRTDPHLHAAHGAQMAAIERSLAEAIAQRLGTTLERDPYPGLLASIATGVFRSSMSFWASCGGTVPLEHLVDQAFPALASGLPEDCDLRHVTGNTDNVTPNNVAARKENP